MDIDCEHINQTEQKNEFSSQSNGKEDDLKNDIKKPKRIILKGLNKIKKEEKDVPITFGNVFRPRRTTASYCFQEYTICESEGGTVNGGRNVLPIHVQSIVQVYEKVLGHLESIESTAKFNKYAIQELIMNTILKERNLFINSNDPFIDITNLCIKKILDDTTQKYIYTSISNRDSSEKCEFNYHLNVIDKYNTLMDSQEELLEKSSRFSLFNSQNHQVKWNKQILSRFKEAFKKYGYGSSSNKKISEYEKVRKREAARQHQTCTIKKNIKEQQPKDNKNTVIKETKPPEVSRNIIKLKARPRLEINNKNSTIEEESIPQDKHRISNKSMNQKNSINQGYSTPNNIDIKKYESQIKRSKPTPPQEKNHIPSTLPTNDEESIKYTSRRFTKEDSIQFSPKVYEDDDSYSNIIRRNSHSDDVSYSNYDYTSINDNIPHYRDHKISGMILQGNKSDDISSNAMNERQTNVYYENNKTQNHPYINEVNIFQRYDKHIFTNQYHTFDVHTLSQSENSFMYNSIPRSSNKNSNPYYIEENMYGEKNINTPNMIRRSFYEEHEHHRLNYNNHSNVHTDNNLHMPYHLRETSSYYPPPAPTYRPSTYHFRNPHQIEASINKRNFDDERINNTNITDLYKSIDPPPSLYNLFHHNFNDKNMNLYDTNEIPRNNGSFQPNQIPRHYDRNEIHPSLSSNNNNNGIYTLK